MKRVLLLTLGCIVVVVVATFSPKVARASGGATGLFGVAAVSDDSVWAVGRSSATIQALIEHWDGSTWQVVSSPAVAGATSSVLHGIAAISDNDIWAVGSAFVSAGQQTLIEHWDGSTWQVVPSPNLPGATDSFLQGVAAVSEDDVWAVGGTLSPSDTLIEHWDGHTWSVVSSPNPGPQGNYLNGVAAVSKKNAWAVGAFFDASSVKHVLIEHWDGHTWSTVTSTDPGPQNNNLVGVTATSAHDVWAVGGFTDSNNVNRAFVEHWNGHSWQITTGLDPASSNNTSFYSVSARSRKDVWAVGGATGASNNFITLIEHWNGHTWQIVPSPNDSGAFGDFLDGVAVVPHDEDVWAVGAIFSNQPNLIEAWDGSAWNVVPSPNA
jgi:hypothetical protein